MKAIVCGGGTGGHIYPALAIAAQLRENGWEVLYMGARNSIEQRLAGENNFAFHGVSSCGLHKRSLRIIRDLAVNYRGTHEAKQVLRSFVPQVVIGSGGYAEAPVIKAAQDLRIPTVLHEQNAFPGLANRTLARKADAVCLTFAAAASYFPHPERLHTTGLPIRRNILNSNRSEAVTYFGFSAAEAERPTLLITGGSLGAASINKAALAAYPRLLASGLRIIHICGRDNYFALRQQAPEEENLLLMPYLNDMQHALALADLAISRAGASFLSEAACVGLPLIIVPYPYAANDHQLYNAGAVRDAGAAEIITDAQLTGTVLAEAVLRLINDREGLSRMADAQRNLAVYDAAERIENIVFDLIR